VIDRQTQGIVPDKPHTASRGPDGRIYYEEMITRQGFDGAFTYLYHLHPAPTSTRVRTSERGFAIPKVDRQACEPLQRRLYDSGRVTAGSMLCYERTPLFFNDHVTVWLARPSVADDVYFANNDGDELWYVHEGNARLESSCGWLDIGAGDYVWIPRSMLHRWHPSGQMRLLGIEGRSGFEIPASYRNLIGQLRMDAPYTHRDFVRPGAPIARPGEAVSGPTALLTKKRDAFSLHDLPRCPMDVIGWDGFIYPFAFPIEKFQPKTGARHLPPTVHCTFVGSQVAIGSFVPRLLDYGNDAIPCPYPHSNVDCDELLLYLRGDFTSRRGVGPGAISFHPSGITHGPHPGAYEGSIGRKSTDELAVMIDTFGPLSATSQAANLEIEGYHNTWEQ
jgi:homogentisate 1,2-dioxygenase